MVEIANVVVFITSMVFLFFIVHGIITYGWGTHKKPTNYILAEQAMVGILCIGNIITQVWWLAVLWGVLFFLNYMVLMGRSED